MENVSLGKQPNQRSSRFHTKYKCYVASVRLLLIAMFNQKSSFLFIYGMPLLFLFLLGSFYPNEKGLGPIMATSAVMGITMTSGSLNYMPQRIVEFRKSSLLARISLSPLSKLDLIMSIIIFNVVINITQVFWVMGMSFAIYSHDWFGSNIFNASSGYFNIGYFIGAILLYILFMVSLGALISALSKNQSMANLLGFLFYMLPAFLSGQFIPAESLGSTMTTISQILPTTYLQRMLTLSFLPANIPHQTLVDMKINLEWWGYIIPPASTIVIILIAVKSFNWDR
ncbi:hypothetical protein ASO20_00835 [Mycoplasma sp. (ex Biomphalaria glabrata)]|uniref:ABC transporter permease n=1 Tax=Mycoplasma sp. (ex Biomphalaria glabrata) TaxID=1749074 RepID=UPI00073A693C|nr:ABC transporter permease [Mycoplasma sp. (ex Biomphalaria glabrata)]ALV23221.1 hypothetical protein ASO20_00835 [Mycoplasma sp. (ex Biomphalaria glabrata)]